MKKKGTRGPKPQPKAIAISKGLYRPSRHEDQIEETNALTWVYNDLPLAPESLNVYGQQIWMEILSDAQRVKGYISKIDLHLFKEYCYVYGEMEELKEQGIDRTYTDDNGVKRIDPLYSELGKLRRDFIKLSGEFGFSPSSRTRISLQQEQEVVQEDTYGL